MRKMTGEANEEKEAGRRRGGRRIKKRSRGVKETKAANLHQFMVDSEECHLTGFVEQVGKGDEGLGLFQIENEDGSNEGHALNLKAAQTDLLLDGRFSCCHREEGEEMWSLT